MRYFYYWIPTLVAAAIMGVAAMILQYQAHRESPEKPPMKPEGDSPAPGVDFLRS